MPEPSRIRITGGPWPERVGCSGRVVDGPAAGALYPWAGLAEGSIVVLLDDDPLGCDKEGCDHSPGSLACTWSEPPWSCVIHRRYTERA